MAGDVIGEGRFHEILVAVVPAAALRVVYAGRWYRPPIKSDACAGTHQAGRLIEIVFAVVDGLLEGAPEGAHEAYSKGQEDEDPVAGRAQHALHTASTFFAEKLWIRY